MSMQHSFAFRVAWFDCDPAGIVFYPRFLAYMNEAVHVLLESRGFTLAALRERGIIGVPMVSLSVDFKKPLRPGDEARVETRVTEIGRSSIKLHHRILHGEDLAVECREVRVYAGAGAGGAIEARPVDDDVRAALLAD